MRVRVVTVAFASALVGVILVGCGGGLLPGMTKTVDGQQFIVDETETLVPAWTQGVLPHAEQGGYRDQLQAFGYSDLKQQGVNMAIANARTELARILSLTVQSLVKTWAQEHSDYFDDTGDSSIEYYEAVARQVANATLSGSQVLTTFKHPVSGRTFALVGLTNSEAIAEAQRRARDAARREKTRFVEGKVDDAMDDLDEALEKMSPDDFFQQGSIAD